MDLKDGGDGDEGDESPPPKNFPEVVCPSRNEVLAHCRDLKLPEATGLAFWRHFESKSPPWVGVGNWRLKFETWLANEHRFRKNAGEKNAGQTAGNGELRDIAAELQWQQDPEKVAALKKRRADLEAK